MFYLEEKGETMKENFKNDFINAMREGRVKVIPVPMGNDEIGKDIDFHNIISNMMKEKQMPNEKPNDITDDLKELLSFLKQDTQEKKSEENVIKEGILGKDVVLSESVTVPKGTKYKILEKIDETKIKVLFSTYLVNVLGVKSKNSNLEIVIPMVFYKEHIAPKISYLKELSSLTDSELNYKVVDLDGNKLTYIKKENVIKDLMKEYNLYKNEKVTVDDIVKNNLTVDYNLLDKAMLSLGYICVGENKNIYIK